MKTTKKITVLFLCLSLLLTSLTLVGCNNGEQSGEQTEAPTEGKQPGDTANSENAEFLAGIREEIEQDNSKVYDELIAELRREIARGGPVTGDEDYVVITDYVEPNTGADVSGEIQKVIKNNAKKTIYFPDGEYILANPIATSANPEHSVSLYLSDKAVLKATDDWKNSGAMVRLGGFEGDNNIYVNGSNYYMYGGTVDGNGRANGISVDSGRETSVRGVDIINTRVGIKVEWGANNGSADADFKDITIVGIGSSSSIGIESIGGDNTYTNIDISGVQTGFKANPGGGNILRQIRVRYDIDEKNVSPDYSKSIGFDLAGGTNWLDSCSSEQFATGFKFDSLATIFRACSASWYSSAGNQEVAFHCTKKLYTAIVNAHVEFRKDGKNRAFLKVDMAGGKGLVSKPMFNPAYCDDQTYKTYLLDKVIY